MLQEQIILRHLEYIETLENDFFNANIQCTNNAPFVIHCAHNHGIFWQYSLRGNKVHAEIFFPSKSITIYDKLIESLNIANHKFNTEIYGNGDRLGITRSIKFTILEGLNSNLNEHNRIAEEIVVGMKSLYENIGIELLHNNYFDNA